MIEKCLKILITFGACTFLSWADSELVGLGSYNPRQVPEYGIIGHNCILPQFQKKGYGKQQIFEILRCFSAEGIIKAVVSTFEHTFFLPAQKMYISCGFKEKKRYSAEPDPRYAMIEYEKSLVS